MENLRIKTSAAESDTIIELRNDLELRRDLRRWYQNSYFEVIHLFGPTIFALVANCHHQRDARLSVGAAEAINMHIADGTPRTSVIYVRLTTQLELETILCAEYRNLYFTIISLMGAAIFNLVGDHHCQCDGVLEEEAARVDDMIERIKHAAD